MINCNNLFWAPTDIRERKRRKVYFRRVQSPSGIREVSRLEGLLFPPRGDLPDPGIKLVSPVSPALAGGLFITMPPGKLSFLPNFFQILWAQSVQAQSESTVLDHYHLIPVGNALLIIQK